MPIATAWSEFMQAARGVSPPNLDSLRKSVGPIRRPSELFCVIQQLEAEMKAIFGAIFTSAMLLASVAGASATSWIQASSTEEQLAADPKPKVVMMNSTDGAKNIKMDKGVVTVNEAGAFFFVAAAQIGGKTKGLVRMWMRINGKDVDNSNTEQLVSDPEFTAVLVCQGVAEVKRGDKIEVVYSGSVAGVGLVVKKPAGEPVVPSLILSGWRIN
jgi:hypothetical protein